MIVGILTLVASPFAFVAVAFVVPQFGLIFMTLAFFSFIGIIAVGTRIVRITVTGARHFPWARASLTLAATFATAFLAAATLTALPLDLAYLAALSGTLVVVGLLWLAYRKSFGERPRSRAGQSEIVRG